MKTARRSFTFIIFLVKIQQTIIFQQTVEWMQNFQQFFQTQQNTLILQIVFISMELNEISVYLAMMSDV